METLLERIFDEAERLDYEQAQLEKAQKEERLRDMRAELAELAAMSEEEACRVHNVDSKAEAEQYIREYYKYAIA